MTREQIEDVITEIDQKHIDRYLNEVQKAKKRRKRLIMIPSIIAASLVLLVGGNFVVDRVFAPYIHLAGKGPEEFMVLAQAPREKGQELSEEGINQWFDTESEHALEFMREGLEDKEYHVVRRKCKVIELTEHGNYVRNDFVEYFFTNETNDIAGWITMYIHPTNGLRGTVAVGGDTVREAYKQAVLEHPNEELLRLTYGNQQMFLAPDNSLYVPSSSFWKTRFQEGVDYYSILYNPECVINTEWFQ